MWTHEREEVAESLGQLTAAAWQQRLEDVTQTLRGGSRGAAEPRSPCPQRFAPLSRRGPRLHDAPVRGGGRRSSASTSGSGDARRAERFEVCPSLAVAYAALSFLSLERTGGSF